MIIVSRRYRRTEVRTGDLPWHHRVLRSIAR